MKPCHLEENAEDHVESNVSFSETYIKMCVPIQTESKSNGVEKAKGN